MNLFNDYFDYIVIDEVYYIIVNSYCLILEYFELIIFIGLIVILECYDGVDIFKDFCNVIVVEIWLLEVIN